MSLSHFSVTHYGLTATSKPENNRLFAGSSTFEHSLYNGKIKAKPKPEKHTETVRNSVGNTYRLNKAKVKQKIYSYFGLFSAQQFFAFYSISFPFGLQPKETVKILNTVMTRVRKLKPDFEYLWIMEYQKNGNPHFHLVTHTFLNIKIINFFFARAIDNHLKKTGNKSVKFELKKYNGCDVQRVFRQGQVVSYITKYVVKNNEYFPCLPWNCSNRISALFTKVNVSEIEFPDFEPCMINLSKSDEKVWLKYNYEFFTYYPFKHVPKCATFLELHNINKYIWFNFDLIKQGKGSYTPAGASPPPLVQVQSIHINDAACQLFELF